MTLKEKIEDALGKIVHPGTKLSIMRMKVVKDLSVDDEGVVTLTYRPSSPVSSFAFQIGRDIKKSIQQIEGVKGVEIKVSGYNRGKELMEVLKQA